MTDMHPIALARTVEQPHPEWGDHDQGVADRLDLRFVLQTWAEAILATLAFGGITIGLLELVTDPPITNSDTAFAYGIGTVVFAFATFLCFAGVLVWRLPRLDADRLVNSLAVGIAHVATATVIAAVAIITWAVADPSITSGWIDSLATVLTLLVEGAPAAVFAVLLAVGMVPARGSMPSGTQHAEHPDAQL